MSSSISWSFRKKWFITRSSTYRGIRLWNSVWLQAMISVPVLWVANLESFKLCLWTWLLNNANFEKVISWTREDYFIVKIDWTSMNDYKVNWKYIANWSYVLVDKREKI